jgi:opacity protein-like surface antigen
MQLKTISYPLMWMVLAFCLCLPISSYGWRANGRAQDLPGRWYLGLDGGLALQQNITIEDNSQASWFHTPLPQKASFDPGARLDVSGGVHLSRSWKAEFELGFIYNPGSPLDFFQVPMMANAIYTLPLRGPVSAYVGGGIGGVYGVLMHDILDSEEGLGFGYQVIAGVKYALKEDLDLGLSYKFLGTTEHDLGAARVEGTFSHSILAAVTFKF